MGLSRSKFTPETIVYWLPEGKQGGEVVDEDKGGQLYGDGRRTDTGW